MPQIFHRSANGIARFVLWGALVAFLLVILVWTGLARSEFFTEVARAPRQPVPFSHRHHVGELGIDCRYCHGGVETSASAGLPATEVCMTCHSQIWTNADMLEPVRESLASGEPLRWRRVHALPDFVYFNHAIHIHKGVACETCHGDVDDMPLMMRAHSLTMGWCLSCHRDPEPNLRPPAEVFAMHWKPPEDIERMRKSLIDVLGIDTATMTDCYVCHR